MQNMSGGEVATALSPPYYVRLDNYCNFFHFLIAISAHFLGSSLVKRIHNHITTKYKINVTIITPLEVPETVMP